MAELLRIHGRLPRLILGLALALGSAACVGGSPTGPSAATSTSGAPPKVSAIEPATGVPGTTVTVTFTGTGFVADGKTGVSLSGDDIGVRDVQVMSATSATVTLTVAADAALGARTVTVSRPGGGTSAALTFTVVPPAPAVKAIVPKTGEQGTTVTVTVTGTQFGADATTVAVSGSGVTVKKVHVASATSVTADLVIAASAATGARHVTVTTAGGTSGVVTFTITAPPPSSAPAQTSAPAIGAFGASPATITNGTSSTLSWSGITDATTCAIDNGVGAVACGDGTKTISPTATTTYS